ncbi:MAG TPA: isocitrate lyase [Anaerolineales bacterium]|nr:isocitrate lyase [Anaerolineales bacterium]
MYQKYQPKSVDELKNEWATAPRWKEVHRPYIAEEVDRLRGTFQHDHTIARMGAEHLWDRLHEQKFIRALGAMTGNQAVEMVQAGLNAIYLSGWQVAGDANDALTMYPDQSLYPVTSVPTVLRKLNNALIRADQIQHLEGRDGEVDYFAPIVADAEAGFGGPLNTFELIKSMIEAGAAGIHLEDQLSSLKKCGHMGGKVLVPIHDFIQKLISARLAADVQGVPTIIIGRTDALGATLIRGDVDRVDREFLTGERTADGFYLLKNGIDYAIARALEFSPYVDLIWCETGTPDLDEARVFANAIHEKYPEKLLAYNCSPSFNWKRKLNDEQIAAFQEQLADLGYRFQFITLAGFHTLNASMFDLAWNYARSGMSAFVKVQEREFEMEREMGFRAVKHQSFVGAGYFDQVQTTVTGGEVSTAAMRGSTEEEQFTTTKPFADSFAESATE